MLPTSHAHLVAPHVCLSCPFRTSQPHNIRSQATAFLDSIIAAPLPYGFAMHCVALHCALTCAAFCTYQGDARDALAVALVAPFVIAASKLCQSCPALGPMEVLLVPFVIGLFVPLVWEYIVPVAVDHISVMVFSLLLVWLPGSELIYGVYEIKMGSTTIGGSRLVSTLIQSMLLALGITMGWQVFGSNAHLRVVGNASAFVPFQVCLPPARPIFPNCIPRTRPSFQPPSVPEISWD